MELRLGRHRFGPDATLMMAIVNRTRDSFYDRGATFADGPAQERVHQVVGAVTPGETMCTTHSYGASRSSRT